MQDFLKLTLIPASDEGIPFDLNQLEEEMRLMPLEVDLKGLSSPLQIDPSGKINIFASAGSTHMPDVPNLLSFAKQATPALGTALVAWLGGRYGRKVRVKVGDVEIEANTAEDVEKLIAKVHKLKNSAPSREAP